MLHHFAALLLLLLLVFQAAHLAVSRALFVSSTAAPLALNRQLISSMEGSLPAAAAAAASAAAAAT
jgi:hypothetical protein